LVSDKPQGVEGFKQDVRQCMEVTAYAKARLDSIGWNNFVNPWSNTIVIDKPNDAICNYWSLACEGGIKHT